MGSEIFISGPNMLSFSFGTVRSRVENYWLDLLILSIRIKITKYKLSLFRPSNDNFYLSIKTFITDWYLKTVTNGNTIRSYSKLLGMMPVGMLQMILGQGSVICFVF